VRIDLSAEEQELFIHSANTLKGFIKGIGLD
jgi:hypothetical protein